jgi:hypothetical protein
MNVLPGDLTAAALAARERLGGLARRAAATALNPGSSAGTASVMGAAARAAIFSDALLGAMRARLEELRAAVK